MFEPRPLIDHPCLIKTASVHIFGARLLPLMLNHLARARWLVIAATRRTLPKHQTRIVRLLVDMDYAKASLFRATLDPDCFLGFEVWVLAC